jgi:hypothetical protein
MGMTWYQINYQWAHRKYKQKPNKKSGVEKYSNWKKVFTRVAQHKIFAGRRMGEL